jgi:hypothetical protein
MTPARFSLHQTLLLRENAEILKPKSGGRRQIERGQDFSGKSDQPSAT